nr:podocalyxin [Rattus norvegicus]
MRPTLALSALLLLQLLLLSTPSLSQDNGNKTDTSDITSIDQNQDKPATNQPSNATPKSSVQPPTPTSISTSSPDPKATQSSNSSVTTTSDSTTDRTSSSTSTVPTTSNSGQTVSSGGKSSDKITTALPTSLGPVNASSQPTDLNTSTKLPSTPTTNSTASPHQPVSHSEGQHTTVQSSSASVSSSDNTTLLWILTTSKPTGTSEGTQPIAISTPGITTPVSTPLQPTGSPGGTESVPTTEEFTHSTSSWTPVVSQGPSTPSSTWTSGSYKLKCDPAIKPHEELLILNLTRDSFCKGSPPNERFLELLCHSAKASFKPAEDSCALELAPILDNQAVAVKRIVIETKLSPKAVFELLKDKWDDLTEAGVIDIHLGKEGPPGVNEDRFSLPLIITIVCMASFLLLVAALYGCCHQRISQRKDQQRLTEELQTVENGYHDNPTLEVMETPSEMQEKKVVSLNGELGDSWIVPLDNLTKEDLDEEEDTHL